jgi:hypothetical protein
MLSFFSFSLQLASPRGQGAWIYTGSCMVFERHAAPGSPYLSVAHMRKESDARQPKRG